jgi:hypothetical protein
MPTAVEAAFPGRTHGKREGFEPRLGYIPTAG